MTTCLARCTFFIPTFRSEGDHHVEELAITDARYRVRHMGRQLRLGTSTVMITPDELEWKGDRLQMNTEPVRNVLKQLPQ